MYDNEYRASKRTRTFHITKEIDIAANMQKVLNLYPKSTSIIRSVLPEQSSMPRSSFQFNMPTSNFTKLPLLSFYDTKIVKIHFTNPNQYFSSLVLF